MLLGVFQTKQAASGGGGGSYAMEPVVFDGTDRLARGASLTGAVAGKAGTFSGWIKPGGTDGIERAIAARNGTSGIIIRLGSNNKLQVRGHNTGGTNIMAMESVGTYLSGSAWIHVLASWDLATATGQLYVNGVDVRAGSPTLTNDSINYATPDYGVGGYVTPGNLWTGQMGDIYLNTVAALDLTVQANREKFILGGAPVDLGAAGATPTGTAPTIFLSGALASWHTNKGTGGGFTLTNALAAGTYP